MNKQALNSQLEHLARNNPIDSFRIRQISQHEFRVFLTLSTGIPVSEELLLRVERAIDEQVIGLSVIRVDGKLRIRLTVRFSNPRSGRCEEQPDQRRPKFQNEPPRLTLAGSSGSDRRWWRSSSKQP